MTFAIAPGSLKKCDSPWSDVSKRILNQIRDTFEIFVVIQNWK